MRIPGAVTDKAAALIGTLDDRPFLQTVDGGQAVAVNGDRLAATRWLEDGDVVTIQDTRIDCALAPDRWTFTVNYQEAEYTTLPPVIAIAHHPPYLGANRSGSVRNKSLCSGLAKYHVTPRQLV